MLRRLVATALIALLPAAASAQDFPAPELLLEREAVSLAVVQARPDDPGFRELFANAWQTLKTREQGVPPFLGMALKLMGRGSEENGLLSFLPAQVVRVDRIAGGRLQPTYAFTLEGWKGLQGQFMHHWSQDRDGQPWPTRRVAGQTLVLRDKDVLARVQGTFLNCPDADRAEAAVRTLLDDGAQPPQTRLLYALEKLERTGDLYGVMLNEDGGLLQFLEWLQIVHLDKVGEGEDLDDLSRHVGLMAWEGDLVDGDRLDVHARFETDGEEAAARLADVLQRAHEDLQGRGRVSHWQVGSSGAEVDVRLTMTGFREATRNFVREH